MRAWSAAATGIVLGAAIVLPAVAREPLMAIAREPHVIRVADGAFDPADIVIQKGDAVRWEWVSGNALVLSGTEDGEDAGKLFAFAVDSGHPDTTLTFPDVGLFPYFAQGKAEAMSGTITVREAISPVNLATWGKLKTLFERP